MEELETQPTPPEPEPEPQDSPSEAPQTVSIEEWMASSAPGVEEAQPPEEFADAQLLAVLEACIYVSEEPLMPAQAAAALGQDPERVRALIQQLVTEYERPEHGVAIREVAGGYKMATKAEHHETVRTFVKSLKAPLKLSLPALETLAVIAYKQPVTTPEIMEIRGVQGTGVLRTLLDRKLITEAGRKNVIGKPILYKTTKEFLMQFGLKDLTELPSLKEFEEIGRMAMSESEIPAAEAPPAETASAETEQPAEMSEPAPAVEAAPDTQAEPTVETPEPAPAAEATATEPTTTEPAPDAEPELAAETPEPAPPAEATAIEPAPAEPAPADKPSEHQE